MRRKEQDLEVWGSASQEGEGESLQQEQVADRTVGKEVKAKSWQRLSE